MRHALRAATTTIFVIGNTVFAQPSFPAAPATKPAADTLRIISDFKAPPFAYTEGGRRVGIDVDLAEALAKEMGKKVEWVPMSFDIGAYASALDRGDADAAIFSISITPERKKIVSFTKPYARTGLAVAVRSDVEWKHAWFTGGLNGWRIGVIRGTTAEKWARKNLKGRVESYSSLDRLVQVLKGSRLPSESGSGGVCILHDQVPLRWWTLSKDSYRYAIVETGIEVQEYGIAVRKGNTPLLDALNAAAARLKKSGEEEKLRGKWRETVFGLDFFTMD